MYLCIYQELEVCLANEEQMVAENQALVARVAMLEVIHHYPHHHHLHVYYNTPLLLQ